MNIRTKAALAGIAAGAANGLIGTGGGMLLVPLLVRWLKTDEQHALATSVAIIAPLCLISAIVCIFRTDIEFSTALPYIVGGTLGGFIGGRVFKKISPKLLRKALGAFIIYGGIRLIISSL